MCTASIKNIIPHNQLNSKDLLTYIKHVLHEHFHCWLSVQEIHAEYKIEFGDIYDANFTHTMLQCSVWSRLYKQFSHVIVVEDRRLQLALSVQCSQKKNMKIYIKKEGENESSGNDSISALIWKLHR